MSDTTSEADASNRSGTNAEAISKASAANADQGERKKKSRNRRRKRSKRSKDGVPANEAVNFNAVSPDVSAGQTVLAEQSQRPSASDAESPVDKKRRSKRARRRRRKKNKIAEPVSGSVQGPENSPDDQANRNRRKAQPEKRNAKPTQTRSAFANAVSGSGNDTSPASEVGKRPRPKHSPKQSNVYAALDLGTNNCRLLVAIPQQPGRFRVIDAFSRIVRLGEGLAASGRLSDLAMDRAVDALKACAGKLEGHKARGVRLIATEACRRADNGREFLDRVRRESGLELEIVDRETEAKLAVTGCASLVDRQATGAVLFDIGGGSSELALLDLRRRHRYDLARSVASWTSLPLGVVTLSEKHGGGKTVTRGIFYDMVDEVIDILHQFEGRNALEEAAEQGEVHLLGTSGTVTTLAGIHLKLPRYDRRMVDGTWMASQEVDDMIEALLEMSFEQRVENPCIGKNRADLVLAGCAILVAIQKLWPCPRLRVADRGLREGLLTQMMNADNAWQRRPVRYRQRGK